MLIPFLCLGGAVAGSYALFPSTWYKLRHRLRRERGLAVGTLYLTFDDGPSPEHTARLLDLLARYGVLQRPGLHRLPVRRSPGGAQGR